MRVLYSLVIAFSTPFVLLYFCLRGLRDRSWLRRWGERFGFVPANIKAGGILLHAASVGEFNASRPLIKALQDSYPDLPLTISTLTPSGAAQVRDIAGDKLAHVFIPIDLPGAAARFLKRLAPRLIIVMETEIWPNLYLQAARLDIPLMIANARISRRSAHRYQKMPNFTRQIMHSVSWFGAQTADDEDRFISCGADPRRAERTGNLKFDLDVSADLTAKAQVLRAGWNPHRPVLVAGSTHQSDEAIIVPAFCELLAHLPEALLILVPRHPERFNRATQFAKAAGLQVALHSEAESCSEMTQCFVIDSMGLLMTYYACADVAFVGGSMGDAGGHNALEAAALGKPVMLGRNTENASEIAALLLGSGAALRVNNQQEFLQTAETLLTNSGLRTRMGQAGKALVEQNTGALKLTLNAIERQLFKPEQPD